MKAFRAPRLFILSAFILVLVCACTSYPKDYEEAQKLCEKNGGIDVIFYYVASEDVRCKNGAYFEDFQANESAN